MAQIVHVQKVLEEIQSKMRATEDDETRDRASVAVSVLKGAMDEFPYVAPDEDAEPVPEEEPAQDAPQPGDPAAFVLLQGLPMSFDRLNRSLRAYVKAPTALESAEQLTFNALPIVEEHDEAETTADNLNDVGADDALMAAVAGEKEENDGQVGKMRRKPRISKYKLREMSKR